MHPNSSISLITIVILTLLLSCNAYAAKVVSGDENSATVAIDKFKNPEKSLSKATKKAEKHCKKHNKIARLERTEKAGKKDKGAIAYYSCISTDGKSSEKDTAIKSEESSEEADYGGY